MGEWNATFVGPDGSPYAGGIFMMDVEFPKNFPFKPPTCKFTTKIYHVNVDDEGNICLPMLKDQWSPGVTMERVFKAIYQQTFHDANPDDPLNPEASVQYKNNRAKYDKTARDWTAKHAM